ncbi:MAG: Rrf2 family transcriptional regulator [Candidatus Sungbacteria bacterium]|nr:Rrf2 family transcriptional regulator [Candidatus Sungbacteria bacterium]
MAQFSRKTDYALILLEALKPTFASGGFLTLRAVTERESLPRAFLEKIASKLKKEKVVAARKGADGGYRLIRDPNSLTLKEVIDIFEEPPMMRCMRSPDPQKHCALAVHCPTRSKWREIEKRVNFIFERVTIDSL